MREIIYIQLGQCGNQMGAKSAQTGPSPATHREHKLETLYAFTSFTFFAHNFHNDLVIPCTSRTEYKIVRPEKISTRSASNIVQTSRLQIH
ncbi:hypothetical protein FGIG_08040 [Fasciola gigantica]|uniref:Uncharacterized protein n=1 Tax=Fasciola gigantica TaxID=46835 RepID=A0A504YHS1_FASGI|nr:hypothetical protein FGIG_08040 [Fasciola gigantica]